MTFCQVAKLGKDECMIIQRQDIGPKSQHTTRQKPEGKFIDEFDSLKIYQQVDMISFVVEKL